MTPLALDWGDVATWFTGLLTAGSLLLGFSILKGDRRREKRSQASQIAFSQKFSRLEKSYDGLTNDSIILNHITIWNCSTMPIFQIEFTNLSQTTYDLDIFAMEPVPITSSSMIPPGDTETIERPTFYGESEAMCVEFRDAAGLIWEYEPSRHQLRQSSNSYYVTRKGERRKIQPR